MATKKQIEKGSRIVKLMQETQTHLHFMQTADKYPYISFGNHCSPVYEIHLDRVHMQQVQEVILKILNQKMDKLTEDLAKV